MSRQIGKIRISAGLIDNRDTSVLDLFRSIDFFIISVDSFNSYDEYIYTGYSNHFQPLLIGERIPFYKIIQQKAIVTQDV